MLNAQWKIIIAAIPIVLLFLYMFVRYVPWLLASKPVAMIEFEELKNSEVPEGALSFAINHGKAMYYFEPVPSETPGLAFAVVIVFCIVFLVLFYLGRKLKKFDNVT